VGDSSIPALGTFDSWVRVVGGTLHTAGIEDFLGNLADTYAEAEEAAGEWEAFLAAWHYHLGNSVTTAKKIAEKLATWGDDDEVGTALRAGRPSGKSCPRNLWATRGTRDMPRSSGRPLADRKTGVTAATT
jgi:hypothetical protein